MRANAFNGHRSDSRLKTTKRTSRNLSIHKKRSLMTNQSDHVYRYNLVDAISFTLCWLPNYMVDISQPFVSQELVYTLGVTESTWNMRQVRKIVA